MPAEKPSSEYVQFDPTQLTAHDVNQYAFECRLLNPAHAKLLEGIMADPLLEPYAAIGKILEITISYREAQMGPVPEDIAVLAGDNHVDELDMLGARERAARRPHVVSRRELVNHPIQAMKDTNAASKSFDAEPRPFGVMAYIRAYFARWKHKN